MPDETPAKSEDGWTNGDLIAHLQGQPADKPASHISRKRFSEVIGDRNAAREQATAAAAELEVAKGERAKYAEEVKAWSGKAAAWDEERGIMRAGWTDPEAIDALRYSHARLPDEGRPTLAEFAASVKAAPDKAPKILQAFVTMPAAAKAAADPAPPAPKAPPSGLAGAAPASVGAAAPLDAANIRALREECLRTNNWDAWDKAMGTARKA